MVQLLNDDFRQRNALRPQKLGKFISPGHCRPAMLGGNTHHNRLSIFERGFEDVVLRTRTESAHLGWHATERCGHKIAGIGGVRLTGCHRSRRHSLEPASPRSASGWGMAMIL